MSKLAAKLKEELEAMLPPTVFFFFALHLVALMRSLMLKGAGIEIGTTASVLVASLILGKAVLIADLLPLINRYPEKPLIYNIGWKTVIYTLMAMLIHYLERLVEFWRQAGGFVAGNRSMLAEMVWAHFWAVQLLLMTLILMYCTMTEVIRAVGADRMRRMFFGPIP
jgi:hypothetical protein